MITTVILWLVSCNLIVLCLGCFLIGMELIEMRWAIEDLSRSIKSEAGRKNG